jgi:hypothetical protein
MKDHTRLRTLLFVGLTLLPPVWAGACNNDDDNPTSPTLPADVEALRQALTPFSSLTIAKNAGYDAKITDCLSNGDEGAMGVHFAKPGLLDANLDKLNPEALIYEPGNNGEMSLVGVEFIVPFTAVPKTAPAPTLFGQTFMVAALSFFSALRNGRARPTASGWHGGLPSEGVSPSRGFPTRRRELPFRNSALSSSLGMASPAL